MSYEEIFEMMQEIGLPFAYHHFAEGESPNPPFVVYLSPGENTFSADNLMYHNFKRLDIELYTDEKSPETEQKVEENTEVKTDTLSLKASVLPNGIVKPKTCENTDETTYNNWYKSVYIPVTTTTTKAAKNTSATTVS